MYQNFKNKIFNTDALKGLGQLPDNSVDCCVTSPPYFALRDYGVDGQIGIEQTPDEYVDRITDVFQEVFRVLKPTGTLWLNIGDTYNGNKKGNTNPKYTKVNSKEIRKIKSPMLKNKDLIGIPWMVAFALRDRVGYYLRNDIIWHKKNAMPESVTDRCTQCHEHIFLFSKSNKYYFDNEAISEPCTDQNRANWQCGSPSNGINKYRNDNDLGTRSKNHKPRTKNCMYDGQSTNTMHLRREQGLKDVKYYVRNKRDVWTVSLKPDHFAHIATYPKELIRPCILAGCPIDGIVLDPFMGSGTTAAAAIMLQRNYTGFELNKDYFDIIKQKLQAQIEILF